MENKEFKEGENNKKLEKLNDAPVDLEYSQSKNKILFSILIKYC